jgi:8-oxo-dGTP pyrophosphatase MutT (NUDIX family)
MQYMTVVLVERGNEVLLGKKKRKIGTGWWNGYGGKNEPEDTSIKQTAQRELWEESGGITAHSFESIGFMRFRFTFKDEYHDVHFFRTADFSGEAIETEEMEPHWFEKNALPTEEMFPADKLWIPFYIQNKKFRGEVLYDEKWNIVKTRIEEREE